MYLTWDRAREINAIYFPCWEIGGFRQTRLIANAVKTNIGNIEFIPDSKYKCPVDALAIEAILNARLIQYEATEFIRRLKRPEISGAGLAWAKVLMDTRATMARMRPKDSSSCYIHEASNKLTWGGATLASCRTLVAGSDAGSLPLFLPFPVILVRMTVIQCCPERCAQAPATPNPVAANPPYRA